MLNSFLGIFSILATTFVTPFAGAATPPAAPLPTDFNVGGYLLAQIGRAHFSTDLFIPVAQAQTTLCKNLNGTPRQGPCLQVFINASNPPQCLKNPAFIDYVVTITNTGNFMAAPVDVTFNAPPNTRITQSNPLVTFPPFRTATGPLISMAVGETRTLNIRVAITSTQSLFSVTSSVSVQYGHGGDSSAGTYLAGTSHSLQSAPSCFPTPTPTPRATPTPTRTPTPTPTPTPLEVLPELEAFIINERACAAPGDLLNYRLVIRNKSDAVARSISVENIYPKQTVLQDAQRIPDENRPSEQLLIWRESQLGPGDFREYNIRVQVVGKPDQGQDYVDKLHLSYDLPTFPPNRGTFDIEHHISPTCPQPSISTTPLPPKRPAIVCDPADLDCVSTYQTLDLGQRYQAALNPQQQPQICAGDFTEHGQCIPNKPLLGPRFAEAVADIIPGDCRVLDDRFISLPELQDALNRRSEPAAPYMIPLYNSGEDFKKLVAANFQLGITQMNLVRDTLRPIHTRNWQEHLVIAKFPLELGPLPADPTQQAAALTQRAQRVAAAKTDFDAALPRWVAQVATQHQGLKKNYKGIQDQRKEKFPPVAAQSVFNAQQSIAASCGITSDGGLAELLPPVQQRYETLLLAELTDYDLTQTTSLATYKKLLESWRPKLFAALDQFAAGQDQALRDYVFEATQAERPTFDVLEDIQPTHDSLLEAYKVHARNDERGDNLIRLNNFETALDKPKTVATDCEKEHVFGQPVETTWCESTGYSEENIIKDLKRKGFTVPILRLDKQPPEDILGGGERINEKLIKGSPCSGRPGDPWWAADCSCHCFQVVSTIEDGSVKFCQQSNKEITRDDILRKTTEECLLDVPVEHIRETGQTTDHFF